MKLITAEILSIVPPLRAQEQKGDDAIAYVKFFDPTSQWTWYMTEYDPLTGEAFGLVFGFEVELGYFSVPELQAITLPSGLGIERDIHFQPTTLATLRREKVQS